MKKGCLVFPFLTKIFNTNYIGEENMKLEKRLEKLRNRMYNLPGLVWENEYKVDEEATSKACIDYIRLRDEYRYLANEYNRKMDKNFSIRYIEKNG